MKNSKLVQISFLNSVGVLAYISLVVLIMQNGEKLFGEMNDFSGPILMLLLFVFSALVTGLLVLGRPIWLYLEGDKKGAVSLLYYMIGWMFAILAAIMGLKILLK